jgi:hypothetical protein
MATSPPETVTPAGVIRGDDATLRALVARRGAAVLGYCERVCRPGTATQAAGVALATFRAQVVARAGATDALDPDRLLRSTTRRAAAERAPAPPPPTGLGRLAARGPGPCTLVAELLVAHAEGQLTSGDEGRLGSHLARCAHCEVAHQRFLAAERLYADPPDRRLPSAVVDALVTALLAAAPVAPAALSWNGSGPERLDDEPAPPPRDEPGPDGPSEEFAAIDPVPGVVGAAEHVVLVDDGPPASVNGGVPPEPESATDEHSLPAPEPEPIAEASERPVEHEAVLEPEPVGELTQEWSLPEADAEPARSDFERPQPPWAATGEIPLQTDPDRTMGMPALEGGGAIVGEALLGSSRRSRITGRRSGSPLPRTSRRPPASPLISSTGARPEHPALRLLLPGLVLVGALVLALLAGGAFSTSHSAMPAAHASTPITTAPRIAAVAPSTPARHPRAAPPARHRRVAHHTPSPPPIGVRHHVASTPSVAATPPVSTPVSTATTPAITPPPAQTPPPAATTTPTVEKKPSVPSPTTVQAVGTATEVTPTSTTPSSGFQPGN